MGYYKILSRVPCAVEGVCVCSVASVGSGSLQPYGLCDHQAPLSMASSKQEHWSDLPFPPPRDLPDPGIEAASLKSPAWTGRFFTTSATWEAQSRFRFALIGAKLLTQHRSGKYYKHCISEWSLYHLEFLLFNIGLNLYYFIKTKPFVYQLYWKYPKLAVIWFIILRYKFIYKPNKIKMCSVL